MNYFLSAIIGYLIGSFPSAFLALKLFNGKDIRNEGSGNVGTMNSLRVTSSKIVALTVLLSDFLKGFLAVYLTQNIFGDDFQLVVLSLIFAVFAHCFNPWLKFKGGRGLATAAGGALLLSYWLLIIWLVVFAISFIFKRDHHLASVAAVILTMALSINSAAIINKYSAPMANTNTEFWIGTTILFLIILSRHLQPMKDWFVKQIK